MVGGCPPTLRRTSPGLRRQHPSAEAPARACRHAADSLDARLRRVEAAAAREFDDWDARLRDNS